MSFVRLGFEIDASKTFKSKRDSSKEETRTAYETKQRFGFSPIRMVRIGEFHGDATHRSVCIYGSQKAPSGSM